MSLSTWNGRLWSSLSTWDSVSTANLSSWNSAVTALPSLTKLQTKDISSGGQSYGGLEVATDELTLWFGGIFVREIGTGTMSPGGDLSSLSISDEAVTSDYYHDMRAFCWFNSGNRFLIASEHFNDSTFYLVSQTVTTPFDVTTKSGIDALFQITYRVRGGIAVSSDGTKAAIMEYIAPDTIVKYYTLSTANDISTASLDGSINLGIDAYGCIETNGSFYFIDNTGALPIIKFIALSTPWDYTSAGSASVIGTIEAADYDFKGLDLIEDIFYVNDGVASSQQIIKYQI